MGRSVRLFYRSLYLGLLLPLSLGLTIPVSQNVEIGHNLLDLRNFTRHGQSWTYSIDPNTDYSHLFDIVDNHLVTGASLSSLVDQHIILDVLLRGVDKLGHIFESVLPVTVTVIPSPYTLQFTEGHYSGSVPSFTPADRSLTGLHKISLIYDSRLELEGPISFRLTPENNDLVRLVTKLDGNIPYAQFYTARRVVPSDEGLHKFTVTCSLADRTLQTPVDLLVTAGRAPIPPVFTAVRYVTNVPSDTRPGANILRVGVRASSGKVHYRIANGSHLLPIAIDNFSGDIYTTSQYLHSGIYSVNVVAANLQGAETSAFVKIIVQNSGEEKDAHRKKNHYRGWASRHKRDLQEEVRIEVSESQPLGMLPQHVISVGGNMRIKDTPVVREYLTVFSNGSMQLTTPLNYEIIPQHTITFSIIVENIQTLQDSPQPITIIVRDVDEPPRFINAPVPYLAVVPANVPIGYGVYKFSARDENGDGDTNVKYNLISTEPEGMFKVDSDGRVKTLKNRYEEGETYRVYVQAEDLSSTDANRKFSEIAVLDVRGGSRPPQFFEPEYHVDVPENTPEHTSVVRIQAYSFERGPKPTLPITFSMVVDSPSSSPTQLSTTFTIDSQTGVVHLNKMLDYDQPSQPRLFKLKVTAHEEGKITDVPLEINVTDVNDNAPYFTQPLYTSTIDEDYPIGQPILTVSARDKDSGVNAHIDYSVSDGNFTVNERGAISPRITLDADQNLKGYYIYRFNVTATDRGYPRRSSTSKIQIRTDNVNDERPLFRPTSQYMEYVTEDSQGNTPIVIVQAQDPDKDQVRYHFHNPSGGNTQQMGLFSIDTDTGLIKLRSGVRPNQLDNQDVFNVTVVAVDDGSCCSKGRSTTSHTSYATVMIGVTDVNNNKPTFHHCQSYSAKATVPEGKHINYTIVRVEASDEDSGRNGDIVYSLYYPKGVARKPFVIDSTTGDLKASPYVAFDREKIPFEDVTVKATDKGDRPLIGFCQFTVGVQDLNDNAPQFDRASYETYISRSTAVGHSVITVFADDRDAPHNARISYKLSPDPSLGDQALHERDVSYFHIRQDSGEVTLISPLPPNREKFRFLVEASDGGSPEAMTSRVAAIINVRGNEQTNPKWINSPDCPEQVTFDEDTQINTVFFRCHAIAGSNPNNPISYSMRNGVKSSTNGNQDFREFLEKENGRDWVVIRNLRGLDYEKTRSYSLTLSAQDLKNGNSIDKTVLVMLRDRNDEIPKFKLDQFSGHVLEELNPNAMTKPVASVVAFDADTPNTPASSVRYSLLKGTASNLFRINPKTGEIFATTKFDRELNDSFILDVQAEDGSISDLPGARGPNKDITRVQVIVQDVNDNSPFFNQTLYLGVVKENAEVGQNVMTVKAHDKDRDSTLKYSLIPDRNSAHSGAFGVRANSGTVFVAEPLDFETKKVYKVGLRVTDGKFEAETRIEINVTDVNDNAPQFDKPQYSMRIVEEDNNVPKQLVTVRAHDRDMDEASRDIIYRIEGQGAGEFFTVDRRTGLIQVIKPLDRDPPNGASQWNFIVQGIDDGGRGLVGYADVQVILTDINDNAPIFPGGSSRGFIEENKIPPPNGVYVMTMNATDYDDPMTPNAHITYSIRSNKIINNVSVFEIDPNTGKIFAKIKLDRENPSHREFEIEIDAADRGSPRALNGKGRALIKVVDVNDNAPYFKRQLYNVTVAETVRVSTPVLTLSASDFDDEAEDNVLQYNLVDDGQLGFQYFYMTSDPDSHQSYVGNLRVNKALDMKLYAPGAKLMRVRSGRETRVPTISQVLHIREDFTPQREIAQYRVVDPGYTGANLTFRINRTSDDQRQFFISADGNLFVARPLDREVKAKYNLIIEAEDSGGNVGTSHVNIQVIDVNDNAPELQPVPNPPMVYENESPNQLVTTVKCVDSDTPENGPPFVMKAYGSSINSPDFDLRFDQTADNGNGAMRVTAKRTFDREVDGNTITVPIQVFDSGDPQQSAVRNLEVIIGDRNDNPMSDGQKDIFVYNYMGKMPRSVIGRVYVTDKDDWDLGDKTFKFFGAKPPQFDVEPEFGNIYMEAGVLEGTYTLQVQVEDTARGETAVGTVHVTVQQLPEEAFENSGSVLLKGIDAQTFIGKDNGRSLYDIFRDKVAEYLGIPSEGVQVFSLMDQGGKPNLLEVYFSAHASPYRQATQLNGILQKQRMDLEAAMDGGNRDISIIQINIDQCVLIETCDLGCYTERSAQTRPTVINANMTTLVGVTVNNVRQCMCKRQVQPTECAHDTCFNNAICHQLYPGFFCECRGPYSGPRCEGKTISMEGDGWAWFDPLTACATSHISFQFMTTSSDGLILYNGPMREKTVDSRDPPDFMAVYLNSGKLSMDLNLGKGMGSIIIDKRVESLADGRWHTVDIYRDKQDVEMMVDGCKDGRAGEPINGPVVGDYSQCMVMGRIPGDDEQLSVIDPLQVGGLSPADQYDYPAVAMKLNFNGCIRNLIITDRRIDLANPAEQQNIFSGCKQTADQCTDNSLAGPGYCLHGDCIASMAGDGPKCECLPGWFGPTCNQRSTWKKFNADSFIQYHYQNAMPELTTDIKVLFLTDDSEGELSILDKNGATEYVRVELDNWKAVARWDLGGDNGNSKSVTANSIQLARNQSYWLHLSRKRNRVALTIDGVTFERPPANGMEYSAIQYDPKQIFLGGRGRNANGFEGFKGCVADYRLFDTHMPLNHEDSNSAVSIVQMEDVRPGCPQLASCVSMPGMCSSPFQCIDMWKGPFCTCPPGMAVTLDGRGVLIGCGENLAQLRLGLSGSAVAAILVCLLMLIVLVLIMVVYSRRRRPIFHEMGPSDDIRENIINYADEGGGEEDQDTYNIAPLRKPVLPLDENGDYPGRIVAPPVGRPDPSDVGAFIRDRVNAADLDPSAPPYDELRVYTDEGDVVSIASLSSISSAPDINSLPIDEQLPRWGPRFDNLAHMYSGEDD